MEINPNFSDNAKNDFSLVEKAKEGNQKAYAELMQRYKDSIFFMVLKMVNNKDDAMDITVTTFAKAFENLDKYRPDFAFSTWLFRIATNGSIDFIRKKKISTTSIDSIGSDGADDKVYEIKSDVLNPEEHSIKKQQTEQLKEIIDKLPTRYRTLIILRYFDELSYEEIAEQMDLPLGTVKAQLFRGRDLLSNILSRRKKSQKSDF
ncbi:RNA polymerase subunit sigma-24 [Pelobium manganitolerans]|uniref:RNA polymerase subunit sigma-24 n=1 Tax=Pelobium manganitolerans TaxID=1842495 RepID=A0A419SAI0_9SPHI|nr:sigma-70 family RNA polymerase sigma factor [Pelobium manganitolerans]RKD19483.1 RNA polymerase subunit sigma-24 [Pelobium manganitolerans]